MKFSEIVKQELPRGVASEHRTATHNDRVRAQQISSASPWQVKRVRFRLQHRADTSDFRCERLRITNSPT
jgi:hypothetical protein